MFNTNTNPPFYRSPTEKDNLLIRNAELFQKLEAYKRDISESDDSYRVELQGKETAIAGLEQSLQDLTTELNTQKQRVKSDSTQWDVYGLDRFHHVDF